MNKFQLWDKALDQEASYERLIKFDRQMATDLTDNWKIAWI